MEIAQFYEACIENNIGEVRRLFHIAGEEAILDDIQDDILQKWNKVFLDIPNKIAVVKFLIDELGLNGEDIIDFICDAVDNENYDALRFLIDNVSFVDCCHGEIEYMAFKSLCSGDNVEIARHFAVAVGLDADLMIDEYRNAGDEMRRMLIGLGVTYSKELLEITMDRDSSDGDFIGWFIDNFGLTKDDFDTEMMKGIHRRNPGLAMFIFEKLEMPLDHIREKDRPAFVGNGLGPKSAAKIE